MGMEKENPRETGKDDIGKVMQLDKLIKIIETKIKAWLDGKPTGKLDIEIHARKGGISKVYKEEREEVID